MDKKSSSAAVSKVSSAASPAVSSAASATKSSLLRSAFAPTKLQLHLFASVIQSFDSHQLRIHDTNSGRLRSQYKTQNGTKITSLTWGVYSPNAKSGSQTSSQKKRKRGDGSAEDAVAAFGTNQTEICMFSPSQGNVVGTLQGGHDAAIRDFRFLESDYSQGFSIGEDAKLVQWDLRKSKPIRTFTLEDTHISILSNPSSNGLSILCASSTPYLISIDKGASDEGFKKEQFDSFRHPVQSLVPNTTLDDFQQFIAADKDKYINLVDINHKKIVRSLIASAGVQSVDLYSPANTSKTAPQAQLLLVLSEDGTIDLFDKPFSLPSASSQSTLSSRKTSTLRPTAQIKLVNTDSKQSLIAVSAASIQGSDIVIATAFGGVDPSFQKVRWQDETTHELLFSGVRKVTTSRSASALNGTHMNGAKDMGKLYLDESRVVVGNGDALVEAADAVIEISSSDEENDEEDDEEAEGMDATKDESEGDAGSASGDDSEADSAFAEEGHVLGEDVSMQDQDSTPAAKQEEPSFGELLLSKSAGTAISIPDALATQAQTTTSRSSTNALAIPSGMSLSTVLTQALRTNDNNLLESCLHTSDPDIAKNTVVRLDSSLAGILISKLAERLSARPGRYGHLLVWVQWICVAHGGAISSNPAVMAQVQKLYRVLGERAGALDMLLLLKGKLDMLDQQLQFRKQLQAQRALIAGGGAGNQGDTGVIMIEGENDDNWDSENDLDEAGGVPAKKGKAKKSGKKSSGSDLQQFEVESDEESEDDEDMPLANGYSNSEEESDEADDDEAPFQSRAGGVIDEEAEGSGEDLSSDDHDEDEESASEEDDGDEEDADNDEDEEDSEIDSFINDGSVEYDSDEGDIKVAGDESDVEAEPSPEPVAKPKKRSRLR